MSDAFMRRGSVFKPQLIVLYVLILSVRPPSLSRVSSPCRVDGVMRTMNTEKLLKTIPIIQNQMDALLDFNVSPRLNFRRFAALLSAESPERSLQISGCSLTGQCQRADQRSHQRRLHAPLQRLHQALCCL